MEAILAGQDQRRRHRGDPLRGPEGRPGHARDARGHRRDEGRRPRRRRRARHRRSVLGRHARLLRRARRARGGRRRPDRVRRRRRPHRDRRRRAHDRPPGRRRRARSAASRTGSCPSRATRAASSPSTPSSPRAPRRGAITNFYRLDLPEILEVEAARALIERACPDREIATVYAPDAWFLKRGLDRRPRCGTRCVGNVVHRRPPPRQADPRSTPPDPGARARPAPRHERPRARRRRGGRRSARLREQPARSPQWHRFGVHVRRRRLVHAAAIRAASARSSSIPTRTGSVPTRSTLTAGAARRHRRSEPARR